MLCTVVVCVVLTLLLCTILDRWLRYPDFEKIPGPDGIFLFENALDFLMDPVKLFYYFRTLANRFKYLFKLKLGSKKFVIIYNPEDVEVVLSSTKNISKGFLYKFIKPWLCDGLLLSDGAKWQQRRKILTPAFHFNILRHFAKIMESNSASLLEKLKAEVGKPQTDLSTFITEYTLDSICETAMDTKLDSKSSEFGRRYKKAIHTLGQLVVHRAQRVWMYSDWLFSFTSAGRKQQALLDLLSSFRDSVINKRRETTDFRNLMLDVDNCDDDIVYTSNGKRKLALLDLLLQAEEQGKIDAAGIGEEVDTFMFEASYSQNGNPPSLSSIKPILLNLTQGHDTSATALQFTFLLLANNQDAQEKVVEECNRIFGSSDRAATVNDLGQMKYLECCIKEAMRLFPPVHFIMRKFDHSVKLKNYEVPAGTDCAILTYDLHRRDDQFDEPLEFQPQRFLTEPTWHPYSYIPFSAGPRNCIGQKFAMLEMKILVSAVVRRFRLYPVTATRDVILITDFILRTKYPLYVKLETREEKS